jgi:hypothetical protein
LFKFKFAALKDIDIPVTMYLQRFSELLLFSTLVQPSLANPWCNAGTEINCETTGKRLFDLSCGWCRSWKFASTIVGDKLCMVGLDGGALPGDGYAARDYLVTADLRRPFDLTDGKSWKLSLLPDDQPKLKDGALWADPWNSTIFRYGGRAIDPGPPLANDVFTLNTKSNEWAVVSDILSPSRRTAGASVNVPHLGKAFYVGGRRSNAGGNPKPLRSSFVNSMLEFNTVTATFTEKDAPFFPVDSGSVSHIRTSIKNDLLLYFGGDTPPDPQLRDSLMETENRWDQVWIYDIKNEKWYRQPTTGKVAPRSQFCTSSIYDPVSKSWQIWAIGGVDIKTNTVVDTVSVLSVPSFEWFEAGPAETRMATTCERVGSQIFVIGGMQALDLEFNSGGDDYPAIAFIYDINKQAPVTTFEPTSTTYAAPSSVQAAILTASTPATWADPAIESLFMTRKPRIVDSS